jgi:hypothetical protein
VVKEKWKPSSLLLTGPSRSLWSNVDRRVRGTAGGDRLPASCPPSTPTASLTAVNVMLNSTVSDNAFFGSVDLKDFYLGTPVDLPLSQRQFIRIDVGTYSPAVLSRLSLLPFLKTAASGKRFIVFRIDQTMYGLKEAGKLSNLRLVSLLSFAGFIETRTSCLFRHLTRPIAFVLVVDDFGIKYQNRDDFDYLVSSLSRLYQVKASPVATKFLGFTLDHDRAQRTLTLSYPGYIDGMLLRLRLLGVKPASSPSLYVPPHYGSSDPQRPTPPHQPHPPKSTSYRLPSAICSTMGGVWMVGSSLPPVPSQRPHHSDAADHDGVGATPRLRGPHRDGRKIFHPSDMLLDILTDASYPSRPKAGSVGGSFHHLTRGNDPDFVNAPIAHFGALDGHTHCVL